MLGGKFLKLKHPVVQSRLHIMTPVGECYKLFLEQLSKIWISATSKTPKVVHSKGENCVDV